MCRLFGRKKNKYHIANNKAINTTLGLVQHSEKFLNENAAKNFGFTSRLKSEVKQFCVLG